MRGILPALQKAKPANLAANGLRYLSLSLPRTQRTTRLVKDMSAKAIAGELLAWLQEE
jgi:electron transfer flavoprotein beta subunit